MSSKLARLVSNPRRYLPVIPRIALQPVCQLFKRASFFLQGQMDISPRSRWHRPEFVTATGGFYPDRELRLIYDLEAHDNTRRDMIVLLLRTVIAKRVDGAFAELGVYKGLTARLIHHYAPERTLHLFDTFQGFTERSLAAEERSTGTMVPRQFVDTSLLAVQCFVRARNHKVQYHAGFFPESIPAEMTDERFAFAHLDADLYDPTLAGLNFFYPRLNQNGMLLIHDYNAWLGARKAVDDFCAQTGVIAIPMPDKSGSALIVKQ